MHTTATATGGNHNKAEAAAALRRRLTALEARFWDAEAVAAALAREVDAVLTAYDDVVRFLGGVEGLGVWWLGVCVGYTVMDGAGRLS